MALTLPTPPTPPTIDKGEATEYTPKIDAHKFFNVPFRREDKPVAQEIEQPPPAVETETPTPEKMAREAVANGAGALTKTEVTRPDAEKIPAAPVPVPAENHRDGKAILREFDSYDKTFTAAETPRNFQLNQRESHSGIFWVVTLILAAVLSVVFVKKFMTKPKPAPKKSEPAPKKDTARKRFEVRV